MEKVFPHWLHSIYLCGHLTSWAGDEAGKTAAEGSASGDRVHSRQYAAGPRAFGQTFPLPPPPPLRGEGSFQAEKMGGEREGRYVESQAFFISAVLPIPKPTGKWQEVIPPPLMAIAKTKLAPCQFENNPKIGKGTACVSAPKVILCIQHKLQEWIFF